MSNWATLYRQPSRLPVLSPGMDPRADWFTCSRYRARLPKTDCANRHRLSKQRTGDGASYVAVTYGGCVGCKIGAAHAAGLPTPMEITNMDEQITPTTNGTPVTNGHAARSFEPRTCARCKKKFEPKTARERRCVTCSAAAEGKQHPLRGRGGRARTKPRLNVRPAGALLAPAAPLPVAAPAKPAVLRPEQIATAAELLQLAGYTVESIRTPAGEFLRVT
jgi:hypothetical protein